MKRAGDVSGHPRKQTADIPAAPFRPTLIRLAVVIGVVLAAGCGSARHGDRPSPHSPAHSASSGTRSKTAGSPAEGSGPTGPSSVFGQGSIHLPSGKMFQKSGGRLVWETTMGPVDVSIGRQVGHINQVDALFYSESKPALRLKAADAIVNYTQKTITLDEGVAVTGLIQPARFTADRVQWQWNRSNGLTADGHVRFQRAAAELTSGRLVGDVGLRTVRLLDHPAAVLHPRA
ncbi:MAG: hypothetical protein LC772_11225 [Chloroflexi bacterium]|nr:hypothetical protein [Chloroflexota bacterium]